MKKVLLSILVVVMMFSLLGCGKAKKEIEAQLKARVDEYHSVLLNINDPPKAAGDEYAAMLAGYLDPTDSHDAKMKAEYLQSEWLKRNLRAKEAQRQNYITIDSITLGSTASSAVVNVIVSRADGPARRAEKWVRIDNKWYRTLEFAY
jgi:hypothetical protein